MLHNKGTDLYNNNGCDYKAAPYGVCTYKPTPHQHRSEVTVIKINKRHSFSINSVTLFIHQAYNNKDLSTTAVMMTKTLVLFFSTTQAVLLFSEQTIFFSQQISISIGKRQI
jgi:hypothetical protein